MWDINPPILTTVGEKLWQNSLQLQKAGEEAQGKDAEEAR